MKKLFVILILSLVAITTHGQNKYEIAAQNAAIAANAHPEVIAFENKLNEDLQELRTKIVEPLNNVQVKENQFDTLTLRFYVAKIYESEAIVFTYNKHHFEVPTTPRINPFKTELQEGREYFMQITYNRQLRKVKHCSGCSGIVPAGLIWMAITPEQAKKDANSLRELSSEPEIGYTRSPRYY